MVISNAVDALLYTEDMGPVTFFDRDDKVVTPVIQQAKDKARVVFNHWGQFLSLLMTSVISLIVTNELRTNKGLFTSSRKGSIIV